MGIQGLLPFLEKVSKPTNVSEFSGKAVAIDAYCWLHKGVFSCADKLARGDNCDLYVSYCMKFINMLLSRNIKPILVFDGQRLPAKLETEQKRRESREQNRKKAAELMRMDRGKEALTYLRRCIDISHEMALNLIRTCRARNIDCIVAPFEADAQLAFLNIQNMVECVITEDSDLLLFGAKKVLFKMDVNGNGLLIEQSQLYVAMNLREENFSFEKFRFMCILSGCDYLPSLPGIGLMKACRFIKTTSDPDIHHAISRIGLHLNMPSLVVTKEYRDRFMYADFMFKYQPVYDPKKRKLVPLSNIEEDSEEFTKFNELIGLKNLSEEQVNDLAYGNLDPANLKKLEYWTPLQLCCPQDKKTNSAGWNKSNIAPHPSIWSKDYVANSWAKPKATPEAPNALYPIKKCVRNLNNTQKNVQNFPYSLPARTNENFEDQIEQYRNTYKSQESVNDNATDRDENNAELLKKSHCNPFFIQHTKSKNTRNVGALTKFTRLFKISESINTCNETINSRYFVSSENTCNIQKDTESVLKNCMELTSVNTEESKINCSSDTIQRSPLKNVNQLYSPKSPGVNIPEKSDDLNKSLEIKSNKSTESRKRRNPFLVTKTQEEKKVCSGGMLKKLDAFRRRSTSFFDWNNQNLNGKTENTCIVTNSVTTLNSFKNPKQNESDQNYEDTKNDSNSQNKQSSQSDEDEGFCSSGTSSFDSSSEQSICSPITKSITTCRFQGLNKKRPPKQLNLDSYKFKPARKMTL